MYSTADGGVAEVDDGEGDMGGLESLPYESLVLRGK
jgi:hypothetical protein